MNTRPGLENIDMIISSPAYLTAYAHRTLPASFVKAAYSQAEDLRIPAFETPIKLFECYCDVTGVQLSYTSISRRKLFTKVLQGFAGALHSNNFVAGTLETRMAWLDKITKVLTHLRERIPAMPSPEEIIADISQCTLIWSEISKNDYADLDRAALRYWSGWKITSAKGATAFLSLGNVWHAFGPEFTEELYLAWENFIAKGANATSTELKRFLRFLVDSKDEWTPESFKDPLKIKKIFTAWMRVYFIEGTAAKRKNLIDHWNAFLSNVEQAFIAPGYWARPFTPLPRLPSRNVLGAPAGKIKSNNDGIEVQDQLLTEIPLHVTDDQAIELLFKEVDADIATVTSWAEAEANDLYRRACRRKELAKVGKPHSQISSDAPDEKSNPNDRSYITPTLENHCATFEQYGLIPDKHNFARQYGSIKNKVELAFEMGIPTVCAFFPHQCLLVTEHPRITPHFLHGLDLYNTKGDLSGFLATDTGCQLIGYKDRRGAALSEMKIDLTERSTNWIRQVIEITEPLRRWLREQNDDRWRKLFLTCGASFTNPSPSSKKAWTPMELRKKPSLTARLMRQFEACTPLRDTALLSFIERVSLSRLRASCGVSVYLKTRDVREMAKALGHAEYDPQLLAHYLPQSLLAFFQSRWIRIFQRGVICLAMKDSPFLLEATSFGGMAELHMFLQNHAIKEIPSHLVDPEGRDSVKPVNPNTPSQVYLAVGVGVLTTLLSLESAVNQATAPTAVSGKARYWADLTNLMVAEIERDNDGLLHEHLATARQHCDPSRMEKLIYDAA
ncbi:hypothetical protein ABI582_07515 [Pseudomonas sp. SAS7]|uniref:hypothetical protein n=1 Tax=Pseudomonas sp. SAS7 TaxID=3156487 RepID=UPI003F97F874